mgnify:FL=1
MEKSLIRLSDFTPSQSGRVVRIGCTGALRRRIVDMGITPGTLLTLQKIAPLGDPLEIRVRGYELSIRKSEAKEIFLEQVEMESQ